MGIIKRAVQVTFIYYASIQGYLVYHLKTSPKVLRNDPSPPLSSEQIPDSRRELIETVMSIWSMKQVSSEMKEKVFAQNLIVEDPFIEFNTRQGLLNSISLFPYILKSSETVSVYERHYENAVRVEYEQKWTPKFGSPTVLASVIYLTLKKEGDCETIVRLEEELLAKPLLTADNTGFMFAGYMASVFRKLHGKILGSINLPSH